MIRGIFPTVFAFLALSCSTTSSVPDIALDEQYRISPSSLLHYRPPAGWLEVPGSDAREDRELWLVSPDFRQSLEVRTISLDQSMQDGLTNESARSVALLMMGMAGENGQSLTDSLTAFVEGERKYWSYEMTNPAGDVQRVTVFVAGKRCLELRSLARSPLGQIGTLSLQKGFLRALRW